MSDVEVPHFSVPFRFDNGSAVVLEQDDLDEVAQCVAVLVSTPLGSRLESPDYGVVDPVFRQDADRAAIMSAINEWEPRAVPDVTVQPDKMDELVRHLQVRVGESEVEI